MHLNNLRIKNFRNHKDSYFDFGSKTNLIVGENGQGKTNVIEAIGYICLTKSFYALNDKTVINCNSDLFEVEGEIKNHKSDILKVRVAYSDNQNEKVYTINKHRVAPLSSVIGKFPVVICAPEYGPVTMSGPSERRKFIDFVISQSDSKYFQNLIEYRRIIKNRNKILLDSKIKNQNTKELLEPWNEQLIEKGTYLILSRKKFVSEFKDYIQSSYDRIVDKEERISIEYKPGIGQNINEDEDKIQENFRDQLYKSSTEELRICSTLVGPHRDELVFKINDLDLRKYASQGQHKTFLVSLKTAEYFYLKERCDETPILLLDDVFSELDEKRSWRLLEFIETLSQTFITATSLNIFSKHSLVDNNHKLFNIKDGSVVEQKSFAA